MTLLECQFKSDPLMVTRYTAVPTSCLDTRYHAVKRMETIS